MTLFSVTIISYVEENYIRLRAQNVYSESLKAAIFDFPEVLVVFPEIRISVYPLLIVF